MAVAGFAWIFRGTGKEDDEERSDEEVDCKLGRYLPIPYVTRMTEAVLKLRSLKS
jgi:hypothetical protein